MKKLLAIVCVTLVSFPSLLYCADRGELSLGLSGGRALIEVEGGACYLCGRSPSDFWVFPQAFAKAIDAQLSSARQRKDDIVGQLSKQYAEIMKGVGVQDKGSLDFPLSTVAKDTQTFSKKIPQLSTLTAFAAQEGLPPTSTLGEILNRMRDGKAKSVESLSQTISDLERRIDFLLRIGTDVITEPFVTIDITFDALLKVDGAISDSKLRAQYDKWIQDHKSAIDATRSAYLQKTAKDEAYLADEKLNALLLEANKTQPIALRQALRSRLVYELSGSPTGTFRISLCPVCRELLESLNSKLAERYSDDTWALPSEGSRDYGAR